MTHYKLLRTLDFLAVDTTKLELVDMVSAEGEKALARGEVTHGVRLGRRAAAHAGQEPGPDERPGADEDRHPDIRRGGSDE